MLSVRELEVEVSCAKADPVEIKVGKVDIGWGLYGWKKRFVTKMGSTAGVDGVRWRYIVRKIKPRGWVAARDAKTDEERLIYSVPLHGPMYDTDNRVVWHKIKNCCIGTTSYNWIREFEANEDVRAAWLALLQKYGGNDSENKLIVLDNQAILLHPQQGLF